MGWVTEYAPTDEELSACVQCGLCLPHCPTFRLSGKETASPRGRLMAMTAVAEGIAEIDHAFEEIIGSCLQCRACEPVCPSMVPFGRAMEGTRAEIAVQRPKVARRLRHVVLGRSLTWQRPLRMAGRVGRRLRSGPARAMVPSALRPGLDGLRPDAGSASLPRGETYPATGARVGRAALLAGCVMDSWFIAVHSATIGVLRHAGYDVTVPVHQTCCGALAAHDGATAETEQMASANVAAFASFDVLVTDAAGCGAHLKDYGHWAGAAGAELASRTFEVTQLIAQAIADGRLPEIPLPRGRVAVQDPCHNRHAQRIFEEPRQVLRAAGYEPVDVDPAGLCCGAAGAYSVQYPEVSAELGRRKAAEVAAAATTVVASANPGCEMQLRGQLGSAYEVLHPVELYWEALLDHLRASGSER